MKKFLENSIVHWAIRVPIVLMLVIHLGILLFTDDKHLTVNDCLITLIYTILAVGLYMRSAFVDGLGFAINLLAQGLASEQVSATSNAPAQPSRLGGMRIRL